MLTSFFHLSRGLTVPCHYRTFMYYECVIRDIVIGEEVDSIKIVGGDQVGDSHDDRNVLNVLTSGTLIHSMPMEILEKFVNLEFLNMRGVQLKILDKKLTSCDKLKEVDFSYNHLKTVSKVFDNCKQLTLIYLEYNKITSVHPDAFNQLKSLQFVWLQSNLFKELPSSLFKANPKIRSVSLRDNTITKLPDETLKALTELQFLYLSRNPLRESQDTDQFSITDRLKIYPKLMTLWLSSTNIAEIEKGTFDELSVLNILYLDNNKISHLSDDTFANLTKLEELALHNNHLIHIDSQLFDKLVDLQKLRLHNNQIADFVAGTFSGMKELKLLSINGNKFTFLRIDSFRQMDQLAELDVSNSQLQGISRLFFENFLNQSSQLKEYTLRKVKARNTPCTDKDFEDFSDADIKYFELCFKPVFTCIYDENKACEIKQANLTLETNFLLIDGFDKIPSNEVQSIFATDSTMEYIPEQLLEEFNKITKLELNSVGLLKLNALKSCSELTNISLNFNLLVTLEEKTFAPCTMLKEIHINGNLIETIDKKAFEGLSSLEKLYIKNNFKSMPNPPASVTLHPDIFQSVANLTHLNLNLFQTVDFNTSLQKFYLKLISLNLRNNGIIEITSETFNNKSILKELILADNQITNINMTDLRRFGYLNLLNFSNNNLSTLPRSFFEGLDFVTTCDLSYNNFEDIPETVRNLPDLQQMSLKNNRLSRLTTQFDETLTKLVTLDLSNNKIESISPMFFKSMPNLANLTISKNDCIDSNTTSFKDLSSDLNDCYQNYVTETFCVFNYNTRSGYSCKFMLDQADIVIDGSERKHLENKTDNDVEYLFFKNKVLTIDLDLILDKFNYLKTIELWKASITKLTKINHCSKMKKMDLRRNQIGMLEDGVFAACKEMETLILIKNDISEIGELAFKGLTKISFIDLSFNEITDIAEEVFNFELMTNLKVLKLSHNKISHTPIQYILFLKNLEVLNLSHNNINHLNFNLFTINVGNLRELYLNSNGIRNASPAITEIFPKLVYLNIEANHIGILDISFYPLRSLQYLDISNNDIETIVLHNRSMVNLVDFFAVGNVCINESFENIESFDETLSKGLGNCTGDISDVNERALKGVIEMFEILNEMMSKDKRKSLKLQQIYNEMKTRCEELGLNISDFLKLL